MNTEPIRKLILESREGATPPRLSEIAVELSSYYATLSEEMENVLVFKADRWLELRNKDYVKSDKMADKLWDASDEGKQEIRLRSQLKYIEKVLSNIRMRLRIREGESFGRY